MKAQQTWFIKQIGPSSCVGTPVLVGGEIEEIRGEHVLVSGFVRPLKPKEWFDPIKSALKSEREKRKEKLNVQEKGSDSNPNIGGRPANPDGVQQGQGHAIPKNEGAEVVGGNG